MDLLEFGNWLEAERERQGIPKDATIDWCDIGAVDVEHLELTYNPETNSVSVSSL